MWGTDIIKTHNTRRKSCKLSKTPLLLCRGGGKKYAHYLNFGQPNVATTYPEWGVYVGPIITDSGDAFTYQTLFNWLNARFGPNPAISPRIRGVPATGRYLDDEVCAFGLNGGMLCFIAWKNNMMVRLGDIPDFDDFEFVDSVVEI